jgi:putative MFS transporter
MAEVVSWRTNFLIGGIMGLVLLVMRIRVSESKMYNNAKAQDSNKDSIERGNFFALFTNWKRFIKYIKCISLGLQIWFITGILVQRTASLFGPALNI